MIRRRLEETGRFDNLLILLEKNAEFEPRRMVACRVSHGRMPCLPWSYPESKFRFSGSLPRWLGKVAALAVGDRCAPVHGHKVGFWVNLPIGNRTAGLQFV